MVLSVRMRVVRGRVHAMVNSYWDWCTIRLVAWLVAVAGFDVAVWMGWRDSGRIVPARYIGTDGAW